MRKLLFLAILLNLVCAVFASAYDINKDKDVNQFEGNDYLDLTKSAAGEGLRTTGKNADFLIASLVIIMGLSAIGLLYVRSRH